MNKRQFLRYIARFGGGAKKNRRLADILAGNSVKLYCKYREWLKE